MKIRNWFKKTEDEVIQDAVDIFDGVKENIELVMAVLGSVLISALLSIIRIEQMVTVTKWTLFGMVLELLVGPFIMLFMFKLISERRDKRFKKLRKANDTCITALRKANKDKDDIIYINKLELQEKCNVHKLEMARLEYEKDMEIASLKIKLETSNTKIDLLETELNLACSE